MSYQFIREDTLEEARSVSQHNEHQVLPWKTEIYSELQFKVKDIWFCVCCCILRVHSKTGQVGYEPILLVFMFSAAHLVSSGDESIQTL